MLLASISNLMLCNTLAYWANCVVNKSPGTFVISSQIPQINEKTQNALPSSKMSFLRGQKINQNYIKPLLISVHTFSMNTNSGSNHRALVTALLQFVSPSIMDCQLIFFNSAQPSVIFVSKTRIYLSRVDSWGKCYKTIPQ